MKKLLLKNFIKYLLMLLIALLVSCDSSSTLGGLLESKTDKRSDLPPDISQVQSTSTTTVQVAFSEDVDQVSAETTSNYSIPGLTVISASRNLVDYKIVELATTTQDNSSYTLTVINVKDTTNHAIITPVSGSFSGTDGIVPTVATVAAITPTSVRVTFSESVELSTSQTVANYSIPGLTVSSAARDGSNYSIVNLTTSTQYAIVYTATISNVKDLNNNIIGLPNSGIFTGIDGIPPAITGVVSLSSTSIRVTFSEDVDLTTSETSANYSISGLTVSSALRDVVNFNIVDVTTSVQDNLSYTITVSNVKDLNNNAPGGGLVDSFWGTDGIRPTVSIVESISSTKVRVTFSEDVDQTTAETTGNYSISGLTISSAVRNVSDNSIVQLTTSQQQEISYLLTVTNVKDNFNNLIFLPNTGGFIGDSKPIIKNVYSIDNTTVVIYFSKAMDISDVETEFNYSISPFITVSTAVRDLTDSSKVTLTTGSQISGTDYQLTISNVKDENGVSLADPNYENFTGTGVIDTIEPVVLSADLVDSDTVEVVFSEPMDTATVETSGNYTIKNSDNAAAAIASITQQSDTSKVHIDMSSALSDHLYSIVVSANVKDLSNNSIQSYPGNSTFFDGEGPLPVALDDGPVIIDPTGDAASNISWISYHRGRIYIGPALNDNSLFSIQPDGSDPQMSSLYIRGELGTSEDLAAGPDGELGTDIIVTGTINNKNYMFFGPRPASNVYYIYYTVDSGSRMDFNYIDLSSVIPVALNVNGVSSMLVHNNSLYVGFSSSSLSKPRFFRINNIVQEPVAGIDIERMQTDNMPRIGSNGIPANTGAIVSIQSIAAYNSKIYLASSGTALDNQDGGIIKSTILSPRDYNFYPGDWADITPISDLNWYGGNHSLVQTVTNDIRLSDRAFPAMVVFNNKLYAIRNTQNGSTQLWKYNEATWTLVADNGFGYSDMSNSNNQKMTLLVANGDRLYVGYDNLVDGVEIFRTKSGVTDPLLDSDFEKVGSSGFDDASNNHVIYSGISAACAGVDYLWVAVGKSGQSIRLYRSTN